MALTIDSSLGTGAANLQETLLDAQKRSQTINGGAANYLGLSPQDLRAQVEAGESLGDIATAQGKSVDGLKAALLDALKGAGGRRSPTRWPWSIASVSSKGRLTGWGRGQGARPPRPPPRGSRRCPSPVAR